MTNLERNIYDYFSKDDKLLTAHDVAKHFPLAGEQNIQCALDSLCDEGLLYSVNTYGGKMYAVDTTEELETVSADFGSTDGLDDMAEAMGIGMSSPPTIVSTIPDHPSKITSQVINIDDPQFLTGEFDVQKAKQWLNVIETHRGFLVNIKKTVGKQISEDICNSGISSLASFGLLMKPELAAIAKMRATYLAEIETVISSGLSSRIKDPNLKDQINKYLDDLTDYREEDLSINGGNRIAVPVPDAARFKRVLKI